MVCTHTCSFTVHIAHTIPTFLLLLPIPLQALADFESMEKAFSDLHTRYFKLKELTQALKKVGGLAYCPHIGRAKLRHCLVCM